MMPHFAKAAIGIATISLVVSGGVIILVDRASDQQRQRDCERTVSARDDSRAMWLYLSDTYSGDDQARVDAFVLELNARLPALRCAAGTPVPK